MKNQTPLNILLALTLCFAILKITGLIAWQWVWVVSPMWLPFAMAASCAGLFAAFVLFIYFFIGGKNDKP